MKIDNKAITIAVLILGMAIGLFHAFLLPPFQNPDEIQHFLYSASYAYTPRQMERVETRVLELLKKYKWFHFVGIGPGWENTEKIEDISFVFHFDPERKSTRKTLFHFLYGTALKFSGIDDVLTAFYFMRVLSTCFYVVILLLAFWFLRRYSPRNWEYLFAGLVLVFQFTTILNAVNYDVFMVLFGCLFFIAAYDYLQTQKRVHLVLLWAAAALGTLTKLVGILFFGYILILLCLTVKWDRKLISRFIWVLLLVILGFCWMNYLFPERFFNLYSVFFALWHDTGIPAAAGGKALRLSLFNSMVDSFYFYTGWMGFRLGTFWYLVLKVFLVLSLLGLFSALFLKKTFLSLLEKKWLIYLLVVSALQICAIWLYYGSKITVQGRYLYPLIIPVMVLIYSGIGYLETRFHLKRKWLVISYILFQAVMVIFAITRLISVFYLEMASPHPGL